MEEEDTIIKQHFPPIYRNEIEPEWRYALFIITATLLIQVFTVGIVVVVWEVLK